MDDRKPTEKMTNFARSIAARGGIELPEDVLTSFEACRRFIDENKAVAMRPTEKQLSFASAIAGRKNLSIPEEAAQDARALSRWIDENK
jgi:hypothetical protein